MKNLEILFQELIEASGESDLLFQQEAVKFHTALVNWLDNPSNLETMGKSKQFRGYAFPAEWVDSKYKDLLIFLGYAVPGVDAKGSAYKQKGAFGSQRDKYVIVINCLLAPYDLQYVSTRLGRATFVHEFIHYLDARRYKGKGVLGNADKINKGPDSYFNSPQEFNAYFQEGANEIVHQINALDKFPDSVRDHFEKKIFGSGFGDFYKYALTKMDKTFVESLKGKYEKKFKSRLYQLWIEVTKGKGKGK